MSSRRSMVDTLRMGEQKNKIINNIIEPGTLGFLFIKQFIGLWFNLFSFGYSVIFNSKH